MIVNMLASTCIIILNAMYADSQPQSTIGAKYVKTCIPTHDEICCQIRWNGGHLRFMQMSIEMRIFEFSPYIKSLV